MTKNIRLKGISLFLLFIGLFICTYTYAGNEYTIDNIPNVRLKDKHNHVSNPDGIISRIHTDSINTILTKLEDSTGIEVAVVAIEKLKDNEIRQFATDLFNHWGLGKKGKDNGLLILLVKDPEQRGVVFETGYGIEEILPDIICSRIQKEHMVPIMKKGDFSKGLLMGVIETSKVLEKGEPYKGTGAEKEEDISWSSILVNMIGFILFLVIVFGILLPYLIKLYKRAHPKVCPKCGEKTLTFKNSKLVKMASHKSCGLRTETYVCKNCGHEVKEDIVINKLNSNSGNYNDRRDRRTHNHNNNDSGGSWGGGSSGGGGSVTRF